jgi:hypothetical protein
MPVNVLLIYAEVVVMNMQWTVLNLHKEKFIVGMSCVNTEGMSCVNTEAIVVSYMYNYFTETSAFIVFLVYIK